MPKTRTYNTKQYKHIDRKISFDKVKNYVLNPLCVARHSFLPFIHYDLVIKKYIKQLKDGKIKGIVKEKKRSIYYAGHLDSYIYRYYSDMLNEKYDSWSGENNIDDLSVAYRINKPSQSNIHFAAKAISKIVECEASLIVIGDFESYFDTLNHFLLKKRLARVLKVDRLSEDWYNVFKSITKFGYLSKEILERETTGEKGAYFHNLQEFRNYRKVHKVQYNKKLFGIPQGSPISGVLANVYAVDFDIEMNSIAIQYNGFYQRYSDDFILVLPLKIDDKSTINDFKDTILKRIEMLSSLNEISIQKEKLKCRLFRQREVQDVIQFKASQIDYLGFTFNGIDVKIREKSIGKFYRDAKKLIQKSYVIKRRKSLKKLPNRHKIYSLYTDFGKSERYRSNFIDYAKRAQRVFDKISPNTNNLMMEQLKNRKKIIEKALKYKIHSKI
ncbi:TPA: RNA-dependent DNA polymerase [Streptococcus suis]|uniref:Retron-type reverse transcriptase n=1 Tax=Streptococcus suis TaxID=1307 RepID=A0A123TV69_STRSU|nr:reverse transcriptase domain-containing protein [Streptococcus suis]MDW8645678.1 reverse transcriptase domain-containing protein [Streptococcus suis]NQG85650.1 RNA-dependent DNA polymerase [Streptococcus suis]NQN32776.1 RNA-dependent DNA polymerase [Streptococcus suis]NQN44342.1 RNA-dependent DNA polymerase [Streptococcus suis]NQO50601.1 RNA-dependent DNA polymerase [Streptococcus suis]